MVVSSFANFLGGISAAIVVKLTSSIDDVLWLSAFLTPKHSFHQRLQNAMMYAAVCLLQTCIAYMISALSDTGMERLVGSDTSMSPERILTLFAGVALFVYAVVLGVEYYKEMYGEEVKVEYTTIDTVEDTDVNVDESPQGDDKPSSQDVEMAGIAHPLEIESHSDVKVDEEYQPSFDKESRSLFVVAFLGSLDDLALFVPMLVGKTFGILELVIGALVSTLGIVSICLFLTQCQLVADALEKVPLVAIVTAFSLVLLIKGIFFME